MSNYFETAVAKLLSKIAFSFTDTDSSTLA